VAAGDATTGLPNGIRIGEGVLIFAGAGSPEDGTTGAGFAGTGSIYVSEASGAAYRNTGDKDETEWVLIGTIAGNIDTVSIVDLAVTTAKIDDEAVTTGKLAPAVAAAIATGPANGYSGEFDKEADGGTELLASALVNRAVIIQITCTEDFADGDGAKTAFEIGLDDGDVPDPDAFTDGVAFVTATEGDSFVFHGTVPAGEALTITATAATGTGTGALKATVVSAAIAGA